MTRRAAEWTKLACDGADIAFREHWAGLVEITCGESRVMLSYGGLERLTKLPPESVITLLRRLLIAAREEQRNRVHAELLSAYLDRSVTGTPSSA